MAVSRPTAHLIPAGTDLGQIEKAANLSTNDGHSGKAAKTLRHSLGTLLASEERAVSYSRESSEECKICI